MFDMSGPIEQAMSLILSFTNRIGIFGVAVTAWIILIFTSTWAMSLLRSAIKAIVPGVTFSTDQDQIAQDYIDFNEERDELAAHNAYMVYHDPEND